MIPMPAPATVKERKCKMPKKKKKRRRCGNIRIMTVKIQRALFGGDTVLIYNKSRSFLREFPIDETLAQAMGDALKKYFKASIEDDDFTILREISGLDW